MDNGEYETTVHEPMQNVYLKKSHTKPSITVYYHKLIKI